MLGKDNPADMMTKAVGAETLQQHLRFMNFRSVTGRAEKASKLLNSITASMDISSVGGCENSFPITVSTEPVSIRPRSIDITETSVPDRGSRNNNRTVSFA